MKIYIANAKRKKKGMYDIYKWKYNFIIYLYAHIFDRRRNMTISIKDTSFFSLIFSSKIIDKLKKI